MAETQQVNPETMSLAELRELAQQEVIKSRDLPDAAASAAIAVVTEEDHEPTAEEIEAARAAEEAENATTSEPEEFIIREEIDLEDGSGVQVFSGRGTSELEAHKALSRKLVEAQKNASRKIREQNERLRAVDTRTAQQVEDEKYVTKKNFDADPVKMIREIAAQTIAEERAATERSLAIQQDFVNAHPDYVASLANGNKIRDWVKNSGATEFTENNLEQAYQSLNANGSLEVRTTPEASKEPEQAAQPKPEVTQTRSPRKASTVSSRGPAPTVKTGLTEDELQSMPMEKLRQLTNEQIIKSRQ